MQVGPEVEKVAFIGLGSMGSGIAENLIRKGVQLTVHDKSEIALEHFADLGAVTAWTPADLADSTIIFTCLPGPAEFSSVVCEPGGLIDILKPGSLIIDLSTNQVSTVRQAAVQLALRNIEFLDAPVSGGVPGAVRGSLAIAVGGSYDSFERGRPLLSHISEVLVHAGSVGAGDVCKLVNNMGLHVVRQALAEMFTIATKAGVDPNRVFDFVSAGSFGRLDHLHAWLKPRVFTGTFETDDPWFRHILSVKDIRLAEELASELAVPTPLGSTCYELANEASARGWDERDSWIVFSLQEEAAGVKVRAGT